jgi:hypothetical protein
MAFWLSSGRGVHCHALNERLGILAADIGLQLGYEALGRRLERKSVMMARFAALVASSLAAGPALAQNMNTEEARHFVTGKLFAFRCVDGSGGSGRIYADGSVIGKIQSNGSEPERPVWLPPGTLRVQGNLVCASLKGLSFEPCFNLTRTGERSFRGSVNGMDLIAYCDFSRVAGS